MPHATSAAEPVTEPKLRCRHILTDGHRCLSPCLRHEEFCYYHHTTRRPATNPRRRRSRRSSFELANPEDRAAIQSSIGEVLRRIASNEIDPRRAGLLLYGLQIASGNLPKTQLAPASYRNSRYSRDFEDTDDTPEMVEEIVIDPTLGVLAPRAECKQEHRQSLVSLLMERLGEDMERTSHPVSHNTEAAPDKAAPDKVVPDQAAPAPATRHRPHPSGRRDSCKGSAIANGPGAPCLDSQTWVPCSRQPIPGHRNRSSSRANAHIRGRTRSEPP